MVAKRALLRISILPLLLALEELKELFAIGYMSRISFNEQREESKEHCN
jgi:hypothetical protein